MTKDKNKKKEIPKPSFEQLSNSVQSEPELNNSTEKIMGWIP